MNPVKRRRKLTLTQQKQMAAQNDKGRRKHCRKQSHIIGLGPITEREIEQYRGMGTDREAAKSLTIQDFLSSMLNLNRTELNDLEVNRGQ